MSVWVVFGILLLAAIVLYFVFRPSAEASSDSVTVIPDLQSGHVETTRSTATLLPSFNQPEGRVYSYTGWLLIEDFTQGYGTRRRVFSKGDAPGLYIDATSNSLIFAVKTYGMTETIVIPNIPAMKWIHFAIVVNQQSVDIYINGTLRQHHTLTQLPDLTEDALLTGPNWAGYLGQLIYSRRALSYGEIHTLASAPPPARPEDKVGSSGYFDITWYIGRLNSAT